MLMRVNVESEDVESLIEVLNFYMRSTRWVENPHKQDLPQPQTLRRRAAVKKFIAAVENGEQG